MQMSIKKIVEIYFRKDKIILLTIDAERRIEVAHER